jgi:hypothetical protein
MGRLICHDTRRYSKRRVLLAAKKNSVGRRSVAVGRETAKGAGRIVRLPVPSLTKLNSATAEKARDDDDEQRADGRNHDLVAVRNQGIEVIRQLQKARVD